MQKNTKAVLKTLHVTEKATMLQALTESKSNLSISRYKLTKYVFQVHTDANKHAIKLAVQEMYPDVKVLKVNTINLPGKSKRVRGRMQAGRTARTRKAIVTLREGDKIELSI